MTNIYTREFLYYFKNQPNKKKMKDVTHYGKEINSSCGDQIVLRLVIKDGVIKDVGYESQGCAVSEGAASMLSENIIGKKVWEVREISKTEFFKSLQIDLTPSREKCALIAYEALMKALNGKKEN